MMIVSGLFVASCAETVQRLSAYVEGELRGVRGLRVRRHLVRCELCQAILRSLLATVESLGRLGRDQPAPQPGLADTVIERIRREEGA